MGALNQSTMETARHWPPARAPITCKVLDVVDGDTVKVTFVVDGHVRLFRVRLHGFNSPEMRGKSRSDECKAWAPACRDAMKMLTDMHICILTPMHTNGKDRGPTTDDFGRILGRMHVLLRNGRFLCVNEWMSNNTPCIRDYLRKDDNREIDYGPWPVSRIEQVKVASNDLHMMVNAAPSHGQMSCFSPEHLGK